MVLDRLLINVLSDDLQASKQFYVSLFGLHISFDSEWFVHLNFGQLELGIIERDHKIVPAQVQGSCSGHYITFVVKDLHTVQKRAEEAGYDIVQTPQKTSYGQLRMLIKAPEGTICDVSAPV